MTTESIRRTRNFTDPSHINSAICRSPLGDLTIWASPDGIVRIDLPGHPRTSRSRSTTEAGPAAPLLDRARRQLDEYFGGQRREFELPLDWQLSTPFQCEVLATAAREVGYGTTCSYQELATLAGHPRSARAVGAALRDNPIAVIVPCHRILARSGELRGFSGGLEAKRWLLALERQT